MKQKLAVKSSMIGILTRIITIILSFITTRFFVRYLGIEIKGINAVITNFLGMLELAELGIGTAISYALYQPIVDSNVEEIKSLMRLYKLVYRICFVAIVIVGLIGLPFIQFFITDSVYELSYIRIIYILNLAGTASSYLFSYTRNLIYADQKQYVTTLSDTLFNIFFVILRLIIIVVAKNYVLYLSTMILQHLAGNIWVHRYSYKNYPYLRDKDVKKYDKLRQLLNDYKNIFIGSISAWVYTSTDNLILSRFVGVITVGNMSNYYTLVQMVKSLITSFTNPIKPMIGVYVREERSKQDCYRLFKTYTFIRYILANIFVVGLVVLSEPLIKIWLGDDYVMSQSIIILMCIDLYISIVHGPMVEYISVLGYFKDDRNFSFIGALINLGFSIILALKMGAIGVLLGTVIAQIFYWCARGRVMFKKYFEFSPMQYVLTIIKYTVVTVLEIILMNIVVNIMPDGEGFMQIIWFILKGIICVSVSMLFILVTNFRTDEFKHLLEMLKNILNRKQTQD